MTGAHPYQLAISFALLIMTWVVFIAVILPFVHSVPFYQASSLLFSVNILSFFSTAFTDPGIYVRRKVGVVDMFKDELETIHDEYCSLCSVLRLKRTRHCKYCNNCVDVFDHHCPVSRVIFRNSFLTVTLISFVVAWKLYWRPKLSTILCLHFQHMLIVDDYDIYLYDSLAWLVFRVSFSVLLVS